tara:strand:- start:442 stop:624 length:183 start_codon:yes stop_codon:yes gene_type:complete
MKWGRDVYMVLSMVLALGLILQTAMDGIAIKKLEKRLEIIYEQAATGNGWVHIQFEEDEE